MNAEEHIQKLIEQKQMVVTCDYFGSPYRGIVTEMVVRPDGRIHLIAVDPRMLGEEKFK